MSPAPPALTRDSETGRTLHRAASEMERILRGELEGYDRLLACLEQERDAIRSADLTNITASCEQQSALTQAIGELEKQRLTLLGAITETLRPDAEAPLSVTDIALHLDPTAGERLRVLSAQLRERVDQARQISAVLRGAATALSNHMTGLMQTVHTALSKARVYTPGGRIDTGEQVQFAVDLKT